MDTVASSIIYMCDVNKIHNSILKITCRLLIWLGGVQTRRRRGGGGSED